MDSVFDTLQERGFIQQCTDAETVKSVLAQQQISYYIGYDATADSLHVGSLIPIMAMAHLQRAGHTPIAIIGGGTTMIGDPSGKTEMRQLLTREQIEANGEGILRQLGRYLDFSESKGKFLNNAEWLLPLNYIAFLRDIGRHFRVNEMIKADAYRMRLEREEGLSFIEFNYQLLQAYDFLSLFQAHGCLLQMGGDDQWGNILAGVDLVRRVESKTVYGLTFPLLTTARGEKMGKTAGGAVWLSAERTSPYEFYQYWINTDDRDVKRFLAYFTFLPMEEVARLSEAQDADIRAAKEVLAYEVTKLAHGEEEAEKARQTSRTLFGGGATDLSSMPTFSIGADRIAAGLSLVDLLVTLGIATSRNEARRWIQQGGAYVNGVAVTSQDAPVTSEMFEEQALLFRQGKKKYSRILLE